jgi:hypothetical protein
MRSSLVVVLAAMSKVSDLAKSHGSSHWLLVIE